MESYGEMVRRLMGEVEKAADRLGLSQMEIGARAEMSQARVNTALRHPTAGGMTLRTLHALAGAVGLGVRLALDRGEGSDAWLDLKPSMPDDDPLVE